MLLHPSQAECLNELPQLRVLWGFVTVWWSFKSMLRGREVFMWDFAGCFTQLTIEWIFPISTLASSS